METKKFSKEISPAYTLMGIRQREGKYLCDQATSGQSQTLIRVLGVRQSLLQSVLLSLQPTAVSRALFAKPWSALIAVSLPVVLTMHRNTRNIHHHRKRISRPF